MELRGGVSGRGDAPQFGRLILFFWNRACLLHDSKQVAHILDYRAYGSGADSVYYFPPGLQLPPQPLRGLLPISVLREQKHDGCEQFA